MKWTRREWQKCGIATVFVGLGLSAFRPQPALSQQAALELSEESWLSLKAEVFADRELQDGSHLLSLETPARAEDAAIVPVALRTMLPVDDPRSLVSVTIIVDENPAPLAARFSIGAHSGVSMIATRVRVDTYSYIHAVAELSDGRFYVVKNFVKATGGCSAPALKNADAANAHVGQLKLRQFERATNHPSSQAAEAQILIRHPNYSGMQMDQVTRLYIPAQFISNLKIFRDDELLFEMEGGISISENPNIRFNYLPHAALMLRAEVHDSAGKVYSDAWPIEANAM
jgi:sulfur-oxidizing protein SoxY